MATEDLNILSITKNGASYLLTDFYDNKLMLSTGDKVIITIDPSNRVVSDNELTSFVIGINDASGKYTTVPYIFGYDAITGNRFRIYEKEHGKTSHYDYVRNCNKYEFVARKYMNLSWANFRSIDGYTYKEYLVDEVTISNTDIYTNPTITVKGSYYPCTWGYRVNTTPMLKIELIQDNTIIATKLKALSNNSLDSDKTSYTEILENISYRSTNDIIVRVTRYFSPNISNEQVVQLDSYIAASTDLLLNYVNDKKTISGLIVSSAQISDVTVSGKSIDSSIVVTATAENYSTWTVQAIQNGIIKSTQTGIGVLNATFTKGSLVQGGDTTFKVIVANTWNSAVSESTVNLSYTQAEVTLIDIPGTTLNVDEKLTIAWVSENQTSFTLNVDGKTYTGTTEKSITLPSGSITHGAKTITLTIKYQGKYYSNSDVKSISFVAYGKPSAPIITSNTLVSSATPYITWESTGQVAYNLVIKKISDTVEHTGDIVSMNKYHKLTKVLENNTNYVIELKIKNQYGLWSDIAKLEFSVQFEVPNIPTIHAFSSSNAIVLNVLTNIEGDSEYKYTEIWKREPLGEWKRMAYNLSHDDAWQDEYVGNEVEYEYKARNIGHTGGISESTIVVCKASVKGYTLYNVEDMSKSFAFKYDVKITPSLITNIVSNLFAGAESPHVSTDGVMYWKTTIKFSTTNRHDITKILELIKSNKPLLLKDCKGHKIVGHIINGIQPIESELGIITITLEFLETSFLEENVYAGSNTGLRVIKWDGKWRFEGTQLFHN